MALKTFQNLKKDRQEEILMVAFEEFALNGYQSTSLSEIIKKLNLAKGSFYRYFSSKKELYAYLIQEATTRRLSNLDKLIQQPKVDFFDIIKLNFIEKVKFDLEYPLIGGFLFQVMHEKDNSEVSDIINALYTTIIEQTKQIILLDKFKGQLSQTDPEMLAFQIFHMQLWMYDYIAYKYKINYQENIKNRQAIINLPRVELLAIIENAVSILKNGIKTEKIS
jgi:AcrR family transcriptional regulator